MAVAVWITQSKNYDRYGRVLESVVINDNGTKLAFCAERSELPRMIRQHIAAINSRRELALAIHRDKAELVIPFDPEETVGQILDALA